MMSLKWKVAPE